MVITGTISRKVARVRDIFMTTLVGAIVGGVFSAFKLPIPAPPVFAGLMGIVGLWIGYAIVTKVLA
jgi:XapX domain-containing protein